MTSSTNYSDVNVRPRRYRGIRSSKKSILYSDYNADEESKNGNLGQRSISLVSLEIANDIPAQITVTATALPHNSSSVISSPAPAQSAVPLLEPRMAQLETLEAKMASIEVSLSTTQRRKNVRKNGNGLISNLPKTSTFGGTLPISIFASACSNTLTDTCRELEVLRNALKDKENTIQNLQGQMSGCGKVASVQPLDPSERRSAEIRLQSLKQEEEARKSSIKKINLTLEQIDTNEANIDVRIKQAELEYELGREELGLLGVREEMRTLIARLDAKPTPTLYSVVNLPGKYTLHCVQIEYDPKSPRFGAGNVEDKIGLFVLWATDSSGLHKGDRILEVNGKLTLATSKEEMTRLLTVCPSRAEIVVSRLWIPPAPSEDPLRRENLRLTHRISYLEDQISELLLLKENSLGSEKELNRCKKIGEGYCVGALKSTLETNKSSNADLKSDAVIFCSSGENNTEYSKEKLIGNNALMNTVSVNCYGVSLGTAQNYYDTENPRLHQSKIHSVAEKIRTFPKKGEKDEVCSTLMKITRKKDAAEDVGARNKLGLSCNLKSGRTEENSYSLSDLERPSWKSGHYSCRTVDYSSETSCAKFTYQKERKAKSIDDNEQFYCKEALEVSKNEGQLIKPKPPKKPIRLSLNQTLGAQNEESDYSINNTVRKIKRSQKGEAPQPPIFYDKKVNEDSQYIVCDSTSLRTSSSRAESCKTQTDSGQTSFRWVKSSRRSKSRSTEKWC